jgi:hypothetical protein
MQSLKRQSTRTRQQFGLGSASSGLRSDIGKPEDEGEGEGEGEGSTQRDVTTRNVEELIKLYKFNSKQDSLPTKVREANDAIVMALKCLGVDVSMVK